MDAPIGSQHPLNALPGRQVCALRLNDEIKHGDAFSVRSSLFAQGRSHQLPLFEAFFDHFRQGNDGVCLAPVPRSGLIRRAEPEPRHSFVHIKGQTIGLSLKTTIIACIGQQTDFEQGNALHVLIDRGELVMLKVIGARLLNDILQDDKVGLILFQALVQNGNCLFDRWPVLACMVFVRLGTNKPFGQNGLDQQKRFLALGLRP